MIVALRIWCESLVNTVCLGFLGKGPNNSFNPNPLRGSA